MVSFACDTSLGTSGHVVLAIFLMSPSSYSLTYYVTLSYYYISSLLGTRSEKVRSIALTFYSSK